MAQQVSIFILVIVVILGFLIAKKPRIFSPKSLMNLLALNTLLFLMLGFLLKLLPLT